MRKDCPMSKVRIYTIGRGDVHYTEGYVDVENGEVYTDHSELGKSTIGWIESDGKVYKRGDEGRSQVGYVSGSNVFTTSDSKVGEIAGNAIKSLAGGKGGYFSNYSDKDTGIYAGVAALFLDLLIPDFEYVNCPRCGSQVWSLIKHMDARCENCHNTFFKRGLR